MHGLDAAFISPVKKICRSPQSIFADYGSLLPKSSANELNETDHFEAAFCLPTATLASRRSPRQAQRSWPTSSKSLPIGIQPVRYQTPLLTPVRRKRGGSSPETRCQTRFGNSSTEPLIFAPRQDFASPRIVALDQLSAKEVYLTEQPDLLSLPAADSAFDDLSATDHRSRFATVRWAYCPVNLLEPEQSWNEFVFGSNEICRSYYDFLNLYVLQI